jgi:hypothetical protein
MRLFGALKIIIHHHFITQEETLAMLLDAFINRRVGVNGLCINNLF